MKVNVVIGGIDLCLEIAMDGESMAKGLMFRDSLGDNEGMIFDYGRQTMSGFWMKNTHVPLDIAFIDESEHIFSVHPLTPYDMTITRPNTTYRWAVEMPAGWFDKNITTSKCNIAEMVSDATKIAFHP